MRERGRYQLQLMKTRSSSGVGQKIDLEFDIDCLRIRDLEEDDGYGNSNTPSAGSALLNSIKNRTTVDKETGETMPANNAPKINAKIESSKLRQLINNLPTDDI